MATNQDFVRAFQSLVGEVFRLNGQLLATADRLSRDLEISTARWMTIATIRNQPMTVAQIARRLGVSRQNTRQTVQRLEQQGLVERQTNPEHRRSALIKLTNRGGKVMDTLRERQAELTHQFTDGLGLNVSAMEKLTRQLAALRSHAEEIGQSDDDDGVE
jgi:DNA-binding MarR family transcriptional regulator